MWPRRSTAANANWTSVIILPSRIDIAEVERRTDSLPRVKNFESFAPGDDKVDALKKLRKRLQGRCTTVLLHGQYQLLQVDAPALPPDTPHAERRQALRWKIKEMVEFPVETASVDMLDIPLNEGSTRTPQVFAVAASHTVLAPLIHTFQDAGLSLAAIDIPELALRNVVSLFEDENRGLAMLGFGNTSGRLIFTYRGELYAMRHMETTRKSFHDAPPDKLEALYERVLLDVQRAIDNFDRNFGFITLSRVLLSPMPGAEAFLEYLRANLYVPVELLDLSGKMNLEDVPVLATPANQDSALLAIGAALRDERGAIQ
jgi:MSHA biogenesis protein MshI